MPMLQFILASLAIVWSVILVGAGALAWHFYRRESRERRGVPSGGEYAVARSVRSVPGRRGGAERKIVI